VELNLKAAYLSKQTQNSSRPLSFKHSLQGHSDAGLLGDTVGFLPKRAGGEEPRASQAGAGGADCVRLQTAPRAMKPPALFELLGITS